MALKYIIGIDEAGRGPLAGPVAVGAVLIKADNTSHLTLHQVLDTKQKVFANFDSKKLSAKKREEIFELVKNDKINYRFAVSLVSEKIIDDHGIVFAIKLGVERALAKFKISPNDCLVLLDGSLKAPAEFINQQTIVRGDASEPLIGLASIAAKVTRDNFMQKAHEEFPAYGFNQHKGYGTAFHYQALKTHGPCPLHRKSFL